MTLFGIINIPLVIGGISILLFFIWLGRHADAVDKKRKKTKRCKCHEDKDV